MRETVFQIIFTFVFCIVNKSAIYMAAVNMNKEYTEVVSKAYNILSLEIKRKQHFMDVFGIY